MKIFYGVQIHGQGHLNRSAEMIRRLRKRGHQVDVLTSGQTPPSYAQEVLGPFEHVHMPLFALKDGRLDQLESGRRFLGLLPKQIQASAALSRRLVRERFDLVLSDFEPVSSWAAGLARMPSAGIAAQYRMTHTSAPPVGSRRNRLLPELATRICAAGLQKRFAVSFSPLTATTRTTTVVGPIVGQEVRTLSPTNDGFYLAYLYSYDKARVLSALSGGARFRVYGMEVSETHDNVEFCATSRAGFLRDLARCKGVILNGSFQAVCEASVLGKSVLSIPLANHYEESFCASQLASSGLGTTAERLTAAVVSDFVQSEVVPVTALMPDGADTIIGELGL